MDALTRALVESAVALVKPRGPVLEIGSLQVQDDQVGDLRPLFAGQEYIGCDMMAGPGVDRVERLEAMTFADGAAGTVLCLNVLEHAWDFRRGAEEILRVTAAGGMALVTTVFEFHVHAYPEDYWRFTPRAMERMFEGFPTLLYGFQGHAKTPRLVFALGIKGRRENPEKLAGDWRRETLARWTERPPLRDRVRAAIGAPLFGRRGFRTTQHWRDLTIEVGGKKAVE